MGRVKAARAARFGDRPRAAGGEHDRRHGERHPVPEPRAQNKASRAAGKCAARALRFVDGPPFLGQQVDALKGDAEAKGVTIGHAYLFQCQAQFVRRRRAHDQGKDYYQ